jgi:hypothetical protein
MIGKKGVMDDWTDFMLTVVIGLFMFLIISVIFVNPAKVEAVRAVEDVNRLNSHYNFNQFLKTEHNGKSMAELIVEAYEKDDSELWGIIENYAVTNFMKCYYWPDVESGYWVLYIFSKEYRENFIISLNKAAKRIGGNCHLYTESISQSIIADLPTSDPDEPIFVLFVKCKWEEQEC